MKFKQERLEKIQKAKKALLEAIAEATDNAPIGKMSEDNGYYSGPNLQALDDANIDAYVATDQLTQNNLDSGQYLTRRKNIEAFVCIMGNSRTAF